MLTHVGLFIYKSTDKKKSSFWKMLSTRKHQCVFNAPTVLSAKKQQCVFNAPTAIAVQWIDQMLSAIKLFCKQIKKAASPKMLKFFRRLKNWFLNILYVYFVYVLLLNIWINLRINLYLWFWIWTSLSLIRQQGVFNARSAVTVY